MLDAFVEIVITEEMTNQNGEMLVSSLLMSEAEIDRHVQDLKADLDSLGKRAKAALVRAKAESPDIVSSKNMK